MPGIVTHDALIENENCSKLNVMSAIFPYFTKRKLLEK